MDGGQLLKLIEEAETRLAGLRGSLLVGSQNGRLDQDAESPVRSIRALQAQAAEGGFTELAEIAQDLADHLDTPLSLGPGAEAQREIRRLLDAVVKAEARISSIRFAAEDAPIDVATFVERSFDFLQLEAAAAKETDDGNFE